MLSGALLILAPLFLGFAIALDNRRLMTLVHHTVEALVYFILALLGLGLGQMEGLASQLGTMALQVFALVSTLLVCNLAGLWLFHRLRPMTVATSGEAGRPGYRRLFLAGLKPLLAVLAGLLAGRFLLPPVPWAESLATWALMLLLFLIGLQLKNAGLPLRRLLVNRQGLGIALTVVAQFAAGGAGPGAGAGLALARCSGPECRVWLVFALWYRDWRCPGAGLGRRCLSQRRHSGDHRPGAHPVADRCPAGHGHRLRWRHCDGFHLAGDPQQWRAGPACGGDCLRLPAVLSVAGADGGPAFAGLN